MPDGWEYIRLSQIAYLGSGFTPSPSELSTNGNIPYFKVSDMNTIGNEKYISITQQYYIGDKTKKVFPKHTIIFPKNGGAVFTNKKRILSQDSIVDLNTGAFIPYGLIDVEYAYILFSTIDFREHYKGTALPTIDTEFMDKLIFGLPPIAEQKRIVKAIEKLSPYIQEYDKLEQQATKLDTEIYDKLKKSILQYAIQGKLVEQDENDEHASVLLERIRAEKKAQLGKKYVESYIYKGDDNCYYEKVGKNAPVLLEELPFDIPDTWSWARFGSVVDFENGDRSQKYPVESDYVSLGIPFWGAKDIIKNKLTVTSNLRYISPEKFDELNNGKLQNKDFICLLRGAVGKWAMFEETETIKTGFINAQMVIIRANNKDTVEWLKVYFSSPFFNLLSDKYTSGTAVAQMSAKDLSRFLIPIPPQAEQEKICLKIKEMLSRIEKDEI